MNMNKQAITLMELMVVVVIVGIMVAFAVPNYTKAHNRAIEREMITNLRTIIAAQEIYKAQNGVYWGGPGTYYGAPDINTNLRLNLISGSGTKFDYGCAVVGTDFECHGPYGQDPGTGVIDWSIYTNTGIAHGAAYPEQVCCDSVNNPTLPCPTLPWCP